MKIPAAFLFCRPLLALLIGFTISGTRIADREIQILGHYGTPTNIFLEAFIFAHLVIVFFRSQGNAEIFRTYPMRFTVVPLVLFVAMLSSSWIIVSVSVLATWWDVYHSSLQTFGLGRIYDMKRKNNALVGRRLDYFLNLLLYAGPILAGATLMDHVNDFYEFDQVGRVFFTSIPAYVDPRRAAMSWTVLLAGLAFLSYYLFSYWRYYKAGYQVSIQKVVLLVSTALCSVWAWGFNTFGEAFFNMNFFHALQYFAIVWVKEKNNLSSLFRLPATGFGKWFTLAIYLTLAFSYGFWIEITDSSIHIVYALSLVVSIMHFWYDGFI